MKVFIFPHFPNPYQSNLVNQLKKKNIKARLFKFKTPFDLTEAIIKYGKPDIFHFHWMDPFWTRKSKIIMKLYFSIFILQMLIYKYIFRIKIIWTVHNLYPHKHFHKNLERTFRMKFIELTTGIIAHSNSNKKQLISEFNAEKYKDKINVIPHGNFINNYPNNISFKESRKKFDIGMGDFVFLFFGRIEEYKGVKRLIKCFIKLEKEHKNIYLLIAGGIRNRKLKEEILEKTVNHKSIKVTFQTVKDEEIQNYMNCSDIVVIPYDNIFTSGSAILAMSFSKPLIIPKLNGVKEILDENNTLYYDNCDNIEDNLYEQMRMAVIKKDKLIVMGNNNFEIIKKLDWKSIVEMTVKTYNSKFKK